MLHEGLHEPRATQGIGQWEMSLAGIGVVDEFLGPFPAQMAKGGKGGLMEQAEQGGSVPDAHAAWAEGVETDESKPCSGLYMSRPSCHDAVKQLPRTSDWLRHRVHLLAAAHCPWWPHCIPTMIVTAGKALQHVLSCARSPHLYMLNSPDTHLMALKNSTQRRRCCVQTWR